MVWCCVGVAGTWAAAGIAEAESDIVFSQMSGAVMYSVERVSWLSVHFHQAKECSNRGSVKR